MRRYTLAGLASGVMSVALAAASQAASDLAAVATTIAGLPDFVLGNEVPGHKAETHQTIESDFVEYDHEDFDAMEEPWVELSDENAEPLDSTSDASETDDEVFPPSRQLDLSVEDDAPNGAILSEKNPVVAAVFARVLNHGSTVQLTRKPPRNPVLRRQVPQRRLPSHHHPASRLDGSTARLPAGLEPWSKTTLGRGQHDGLAAGSSWFP